MPNIYLDWEVWDVTVFVAKKWYPSKDLVERKELAAVEEAYRPP